MCRVSVLAFVLTFGSMVCDVAAAAEPIAAVIVSDQVAASMLSSLPTGSGSVICVLQQRMHEPDEVIDARALALRDATHYIYHSEYESLRSAMYRQRLQAHGAIAVDLREHLPRHQRMMAPASKHPKKSLVTLLSTNP
jgi:hypothetical protein